MTVSRSWEVSSPPSVLPSASARTAAAVDKARNFRPLEGRCTETIPVVDTWGTRHQSGIYHGEVKDGRPDGRIALGGLLEKGNKVYDKLYMVYAYTRCIYLTYYVHCI